MNERLEDLMYQSGFTAQGSWDSMDPYDQQAIERFAELIIRECANVALREDHEPDECILHHFGLNRQKQKDAPAIAEEEKQEPVGYVSEPGSCTKVGTNSGVLHKEWVGLTDKELSLLWLEYHGDNFIADGRIINYEKALEAKLKEKNT